MASRFALMPLTGFLLLRLGTQRVYITIAVVVCMCETTLS